MTSWDYEKQEDQKSKHISQSDMSKSSIQTVKNAIHIYEEHSFWSKEMDSISDVVIHIFDKMKSNSYKAENAHHCLVMDNFNTKGRSGIYIQSFHYRKLWLYKIIGKTPTEITMKLKAFIAWTHSMSWIVHTNKHKMK